MSDINPGPTVAVVCRDRSHDRVVKIATFFRSPGQPWQKFPTAKGGAETEWRDDPYLVWLDGDEVLDDPEPGTGRPMRRRYNLRCRLCGLSVTAHHPTLSPLLDKCADAGVSEIPLSVIVASVS